MHADQTTHSTLTPGSNNNDVNEVKYLQQQLNLFYHSYISVDGYFGNITTEYVKKFQADCGLKVNGIVGSQTWNYLDDIVPYANKLHSTLSQSKNNNPSEVKYLQAQLNQATRQGKSGSTTLVVNGKFDDKTTTRVKQFQSDFGLTADGIVGNKTWSVLEDALLKS
ncbi:peptidoglycan-binding protein [Aerosakkonemataceae cyanobacterium BLCC-F50]|uniref:Peptidoglycan-binding protein n=1 Tax=Floridaenema flaviceps BLCC-F50 TaxID=3153642 RepID=A0ABV4Y164_9CYAN